MRDEEFGDRGLAGRRPAGAAEDSQRPLRGGKHFAQPRHRFGGRVGREDRGGADVGHRHLVLLHLLADGDDDGPRAAGGRDIEGVRDDFRDALRVVDLRHPFRDRREHPAVINLLEGLAVRLLDGDLADQQNEWGGILHRHMHADGGVAGAGAAGDDGDTRLAGELALRLGHVHRARLEPAGNELELVAHGIKSIEQVEVAFARDAEGVGHALGDQRIGQHLAAAARLRDPFYFVHRRPSQSVMQGVSTRWRRASGQASQTREKRPADPRFGRLYDLKVYNPHTEDRGIAPRRETGDNSLPDVSVIISKPKSVLVVEPLAFAPPAFRCHAIAHRMVAVPEYADAWRSRVHTLLNFDDLAYVVISTDNLQAHSICLSSRIIVEAPKN